jgi:hypothetical protein
MCGSPGSGGHRARISADRYGGAGRGGGGRLHVLDPIESSVLLIGVRIISGSVLSASVEHGRHVEHPSGAAEFIEGRAADDRSVAV